MFRFLPLIACLFLSCCAESEEDWTPPDGDCAIYVSTNVTMDEGVAENEPCYEHTDDGTDYTLCCPEGWSPVGLTAAGEVVCL